MVESEKKEFMELMEKWIPRLELLAKDKEAQAKLIEFLDREFDLFEFLANQESRYEEWSLKVFGISWKDLLKYLIGKFNDIIAKLTKF